MRDSHSSTFQNNHDQGESETGKNQTRNVLPSPDRRIRVMVSDSSPIHTELLAQALKRDSQLEVLPFDSHSQSLPAAVVAMRADVLVISSDLDDQPSRGF